MNKKQQTRGQVPVVFGVDSWGYKVVAGPAYPLSLFVNNKGLQKMINGCEDEESLLSLYHDNKERIEKYPVLKQCFTEKKDLLKQQANI